MDISQFFERYGKFKFKSFSDMAQAITSFKEQVYTVEPGESEHGAAVFYMDGDGGLILFTTDDQEGRGGEAFGVFVVDCHHCVLYPNVLSYMTDEIDRLNIEMAEFLMEENAA